MAPLTGIRVIDLTRARSGPTAVRQLADWGADVIKVELPAALEDDENSMVGYRAGPDFQNLQRNKRSLTLDLKRPEGLAILRRLIKGADVLAENFRPRVKTRLGIDYAQLRGENPRLVYGSISGFGQDGPYRDRPGFDQVAQGMGGLMSITGAPGQGPMRVGIPIADLCAGLLLAQGILLALFEREKTGEGQWVTTSLLEAQIFMLDFQASIWLNAGEVPRQAGNDHPTIIPTGVFKTADGYINIAASGQRMWERLCRAIGAEELLSDPAFATEPARSRNRAALNARIDEKLASADSNTWIARMNEAGVPCGQIYSIDEVFADPQVRHLEMVKSIDSPHYRPLRVVAQAVSLSNSRGGLRGEVGEEAPDGVKREPRGEVRGELRLRPPERGEHTDEILASLGYDRDAIAALRRDGIV